MDSVAVVETVDILLQQKTLNGMKGTLVLNRSLRTSYRQRAQM